MRGDHVVTPGKRVVGAGLAGGWVVSVRAQRQLQRNPPPYGSTSDRVLPGSWFASARYGQPEPRARLEDGAGSLRSHFRSDMNSPLRQLNSWFGLAVLGRREPRIRRRPLVAPSCGCALRCSCLCYSLFNPFNAATLYVSANVG